jgi:hypothetical protein
MRAVALPSAPDLATKRAVAALETGCVGHAESASSEKYLRNLHKFACFAALPLTVVACSGAHRSTPAPPAPAPVAAAIDAGVPAPRQTPEEAARIHEKWMNRENGPFAKERVQLLEGFAAAEIESKSPPTPDCKRLADGTLACSFRADLGKDDDGDAYDILCEATTSVRAFGPLVKVFQGSNGLSEIPSLGVKRLGDGIAVTFMANTGHEEGGRMLVGTLKVSVLYTNGISISCADLRAGGRKTFDRVVGSFFENVKLTAAPPIVFAMGYLHRAGERTIGFRYECVAKRPAEDPGYAELGTAFTLRTDEKSWSVLDRGKYVVRGPAGRVESLRSLHWLDGKGPIVLSAKPGEDKKLRLKVEAGDKSSALDSTPAAPLNTELWAAPDLLRVSAGAAPSYKYAILTLDDSDPAFEYVKVTRSKPGVLLEEQAPGRPKAAVGPTPQPARPKDELFVNERGLVTKEVSTDAVSELIYQWGELPNARRPAKRGKAP